MGAGGVGGAAVVAATRPVAGEAAMAAVAADTKPQVGTAVAVMQEAVALATPEAADQQLPQLHLRDMAAMATAGHRQETVQAMSAWASAMPSQVAMARPPVVRWRARSVR